MAANHSSATNLGIFFVAAVLAAAMAASPASSLPLRSSINLYRCWGAISSFDRCKANVEAPSSLTLQINLTPNCCLAVRDLGDKCFRPFFPSHNFLSYLPPKSISFFEDFCGRFASSAAVPAHAPQPDPY